MKVEYMVNGVKFETEQEAQDYLSVIKFKEASGAPGLIKDLQRFLTFARENKALIVDYIGWSEEDDRPSIYYRNEHYYVGDIDYVRQCSSTSGFSYVLFKPRHNVGIVTISNKHIDDFFLPSYESAASGY